MFFPSQVAIGSSLGCTDLDREAGGSETYNVCYSKSPSKLTNSYLCFVAVEMNGVVTFSLHCIGSFPTYLRWLETKISEPNIFIELISNYLFHMWLITYYIYVIVWSWQYNTPASCFLFVFCFCIRDNQGLSRQDYFTEPEIWLPQGKIVKVAVVTVVRL